jgi:hypothetical protein
MVMKVLVNGASLSAGPWTWPYRLKELLNCDMTNLAIPAVGNTYVHESTVSELAKNKYDLVLVMWSEGVNRTEWRVDNVEQFDDQQWTSKNMAEIKLGHGNNDYDAIQKDWILSAGYLIGRYQKKIPVEQQSTINQLFADYYSVVKNSQAVSHDLIRMISTQEVLKANNMPYLFLFGSKLKQVKRFEHLYAMINWENFYTEDNLADIAIRHPEWQTTENKYPTESGQQYYAEILAKYIKDRQLGF